MTQGADAGASQPPAVSPDEVFAVLGDRTRLDILQALVEAEGPLGFSELRDRAGVESNFSYHLGKLEEYFVEKTTDGYALCRPERSALSMPVGGYSAFQTLEEDPGIFAATDREPAELLASHVAATLNTLDHDPDLREISERLWTILETTKAIIYVKDLQGRYTLVNRQFERSFHRDREEILGRTDRDLLDESTAAMLREHDRQGIAADGPVEFEEEVDWEGERYTYLSVKVPLRDEDGKPVGVCGISTDITDLKCRERELKATTERLDRVASVLTDEVRDPLVDARETVARVRADVDDERLDRLEETLERMDDGVDDLLELARSDE
jgi:PAS domain S-box-containing protein